MADPSVGPLVLDWAHELDIVDNDTANLLINIYLEDIAALKTAAGAQISDATVAQELFGVTLLQYRADRAARAPPPPPPPPPVVREQCNASVDELVRAPCGHHYCAEDVQQVFSLALQNEAFYPPRCCRQPLDFEATRALLGQDLAARFEGKREELDDKARLYCHDGSCSAYIPAINRAYTVALCRTCNEFTCVSCKNRMHPGRACPPDPDKQAILDIARQEGWQKCNGCGNMVELRTGCNHMTCRCKAEFCYVCGETWKNCRCPLYDETRLLEQAQRVAERQQQGGDAAAVNAVADHLREHHECEHPSYQRVHEPWLVCEDCGDELPYFIYRCRQCLLQQCARCRFHR
ncbi:uncharacterized protein RHO25_001636 [Cercospora beticola]|uniref:IBR domain-containing protein n=1 Tax=Cercospora beticola TaxID=122368 RepID=A0ABZ0NBY6_CERBT|nr:hypothetical protein RHO25_001636 [Cercospora beticola]CAK1354574.1 unnamed protein product [Cercospora beticola]